MILSTEYIGKTIAAYFSDKPVLKAWIFGSYARGEADENSDVDLLVDVDHSNPIGWDYFTWKEELAERLHKKVDIVSAGWENKSVKPFIDVDKRVIYER